VVDNGGPSCYPDPEMPESTHDPISERLVLGVDLGGTKIRTALLDDGGGIVADDYRQTLAQEGPDAVIGRILDAARQVLDRAGVGRERVRAVGIGSPGPLDVRTGEVISPPNLPGWDRVPLRQRVADGLGLDVFLENDANVAALAEHRFGAGQGTDHMLYVVVGTGVGGGLILGGQLYHGVGGMAGEIGHTVLLPDGPLCGCGNRGCLEALASGTAVAREARLRVESGKETLMTELAEGDPTRITARLVAQAAEQGDAEARDVLAWTMGYLGLGLANMVNLFNPEVIVIGGGLANMGDLLFGPVRRAIDRHAFPVSAGMVRVVPAALGNDAGVLGAAALAQVMGG